MSDRVTVYDQSGKKLVLGAADHLATGGEGAVYAKGNTVFKVYLDKAKMQAARLEDKVPLLQQLQHPGIAAPTGALRDAKGLFIGMTLPRVDGDALCRLFTNTWRDAHNFGSDHTRKVVTAMRDVLMHAHTQKALVVDGNELNWLVSATHHPVAIDVDSWQLPGFPATAIMPSIRDPLATQFTEGSDWFAWAIVTFQLWTGIHPYKGTHPDFGRAALAERMQARASVFDSRVKLPAAVRDFATIPLPLKAWYEGIFNGSDRSIPPNPALSAIPAAAPKALRVLQSATSTLRMELLGHVAGKIRAAFNGFVIHDEGTQLHAWDASTKQRLNGLSADQIRKILTRQAGLVRLVNGQPALVELLPDRGELACLDLSNGRTAMSLPSKATRLWQSSNRIFALVEGISEGLLELHVAELGNRAALTVARQWPVSVLSSQFFNGLLLQDCLGTPFLGVLEGDGLVQGVAPALKGYQALEGFAVDRHNVWLTALRKHDGETVRMQLGWASDKFELQTESVVTTPSLDAVALPTGVGLVRFDNELRVLKGLSGKSVDVTGVSETARLFSLSNGAGLFDGNDVHRVSLR
jgi:hypothetical protein